jgi:hypothetical protein
MKPRADVPPHGPQPPRETPEPPPLVPELGGDWPAELDDDAWEALIPDDDYEPLPEYGDFWTEQDAA